jgi:hypothetical protein
MDAARAAPAHAVETRDSETLVARHSATTRITHWLTVLAFVVLVMSGLQIFNAAPYLDASDKSNPQRRVLEIGVDTTNSAKPAGVITLFGHTFGAGNVVGYTDDGMGGPVIRRSPTAAAGICFSGGCSSSAASPTSSPVSGTRISKR